MPKIIIDGKDFEVEENLSIIQACEVSGVEIQDSVITKNSL